MYALSLLLALPAIGLCQEPETAASAPVPWELVRAESVFAVVTQKEGFAARFAHNHLVVAREYTARLDLDPGDPAGASFELRTGTADLVVDDPAERSRWEERVLTLGLVNELGAPDDGDRRKIVETMLSSGQMDAERFPEIRARLLRVTPSPVTVGNVLFGYAAEVEVTVHGQAVRREVAARFDLDGRELAIEAVGRFTFEEFGIKPYSAFLGSVKNKNEFFIYINLKATR